MDLPSGVVTFLMTDIEASTRLWEEAPDAMRAAIARHDTIAAATIGEHAGFIIKPRGEGDSTFSVFARATDAVLAACVLQEALTSEPWPEGARLRVRVALHTGEADLGEDDYYGTAVNRCARLRSIAHGGQVLVSESTTGLVRESLPEEVTLRDLGYQRLRDLAEAERVSQLLHASLPSDFPALRTIDSIANNLPYQVSTFIGRESEMTKIRELLRGTRLLTLTGAGGVGKTRLALQAAAEMLYEYPDGVWLVELAALSDGGLIYQALATQLGMREEPGRTLADTLLDHLRGKQVLIVLDNCEHLVEASAGFVESLTRRCPEVAILATSREALRAEGETVWRVPSLSVPHQQAGIRPEPQQLTQYAAVRLFLDRAAKAAPGFAVTTVNAPAVAEICSRLDGVPLAIELAAARVRTLAPEQIEGRLGERFRLLKGGRRTALPRQQTLEATVDWSYELLTEQEKLLFARLSVFAGGFTLEAAEAVCSGEGVDPDDVVDLVDGLAEKSLLVPGEDRYWMLETLRAYGRQQLGEPGARTRADEAFACYWLAFAVGASSGVQSRDQMGWLDRLEKEQDNLRAVLDWAAGHNAETGMRLAVRLARYWDVRGRWTEGRRWLARLLAADDASAPALRADGLFCAAGLATQQGDSGAARELATEALGLYRQLGDRRGEARDLNLLGNVAGWQGDWKGARSAQEQSLAIMEEEGSQADVARALHALGWLAQEQGDRGAARHHYERALALYREEDDRRSAAVLLNNLGNLAAADADYQTAAARYEEGLALSEQVGDQANRALLMTSMGHAAGQVGDHARALALCGEGLAIARELGAKRLVVWSLLGAARAAMHLARHGQAGDQLREALALSVDMGGKPLVADAVEGLAALACSRNQPGRGACLSAVASALRRSADLPPAPDEPGALVEHCKTARDALGEDAFEAAWAEGEAMTFDEAIAYGLEEDPDA